MSVTWIDGREVAKKWKENAAQRTQALIEKGVTPHLAVVVAGENPGEPGICAQQRKRVQPRGHSLNGSAAAGKLHTGRTGRSGACAECG